MKNKPVQSVYKKMERFSVLTKTLIINGNINRAKKCLSVAEKLLINGNNEMKTAVSNVFIFSVSGFMELHNCAIRNLFPEKLMEEYKKLTGASGI